jgi:hypothetical protein
MPPVMTTPRKKPGRKGNGGDKPQPKTVQVGVKLERALYELLEQYLNDQRPRTTAPEVLRVALEDWLFSKGYSYPKPEQDND